MPALASARTLILSGTIESRIRAAQQINFDVPRKVDSLTFKFALPSTFSNKAVTQRIDGLGLKFNPEPASAVEETDSFGNKFMRVKWKGLTRSVVISISYTASIESSLNPMESSAAFPLKDIAKAEAVYLKPTEMVQGSAEEITSLSGRLTFGAKTEYEAVQAVLNWVSDNVKYTYNPPEYDALHTLRTGKGNCQNFAHLSMALLRAAGIPSRIVGGISLKRQWKVPVGGDSFLVQDMGQGGHAWMEIYFPDLGWLSYDPQQSRQFTSTRHIKQTHGLDSRDINDSWSAAPYLPEYGESIDASFELDEQKIDLAKAEESPKAYIVSNNLIAKAPPVAAIPPPKPEPTVIAKPVEPVAPAKEPVAPPQAKPAPEPVKPTATIPVPATPVPTTPVPATPAVREPVVPPVVAKPEPKPKPEALPPVKEPVAPPKKRGQVEFGNMEFPALVDVYQAKGNEAVRILDKETAEYATSKFIYAQAFRAEEGMRLAGVSLAGRKFGGDGTLFVDVLRDEGGRPGFAGERSMPVYLTDIKFKPGYYWIDFIFPEGTGSLTPGKYWIVLRHSGEAIVNWFYIPGNPYGDGDDTRSTVKGHKWEDILNYDFVFKVKGNIE